MNSDFPVVLDACVLVQAAIRDTLLRLSEKRLFLCRWSDEIIQEMTRTLENRFGKTPDQTTHLVGELKTHFPDCWVELGYKALVDFMPNDKKDRHVVAAAVKAGCEVIVTYNLKHFPEGSLKEFDVHAEHPDEFLIQVYYLNPEMVVHTLHEQGESMRVKRILPEILAALEVCQCTKFCKLIRERLSL